MQVKWNSERLVSLSAIGISFVTLLIFIYQTNLLSKQNYLSIMPYLMLATTDNAAEHTFEINLKNHGVGPAILESVMLEYKGKRYNLVDYDHDLYKFLVSRVPALDRMESYSSSTVDPGIAIPANSSYNVLRVSDSPEDYQLIRETLQELLSNGFTPQVIYRSIQDERWLVSNRLQGPLKLN